MVLACSFCGLLHDVLVDGGPHRAACGRTAEAFTASGTIEGRVWGTEAERKEMRRARVT